MYFLMSLEEITEFLSRFGIDKNSIISSKLIK